MWQKLAKEKVPPAGCRGPLGKIVLTGLFDGRSRGPCGGKWLKRKEYCRSAGTYEDLLSCCESWGLDVQKKPDWVIRVGFCGVRFPKVFDLVVLRVFRFVELAKESFVEWLADVHASSD